MKALSQPAEKAPNLPRCVRKYQLRDYFGCSYRHLWRFIITEDLFLSWGYDPDKLKRRRIFSPELTKLIYTHFQIRDLDADLSEEITGAMQENQGS
ncbi:hypothetical protein [Lewinella sp. W8]|uniref:hypothetical protein n=1 Tax=Lewinella sp. W8 TaxID=2528208 RepID=UPI001068389D|nr:hypothetical protein [Lewinella sp. W8]MTB53902.1 hypothetical protein [Lewinella sp. W8]